MPATNEAQFGFAVDVDTGPKNLALAQAHLGGLASSGDPRGFRDGGYATVPRAAAIAQRHRGRRTAPRGFTRAG